MAQVVVFGKNEKDDLTPADRKAIAAAIQVYRAELDREFGRTRTRAKRRRRRQADGQAKAKRTVEKRTGPSRRTDETLTPAGARIVAAFEEATEAMRSGEPPERRFTVRTYKTAFDPGDYGPDDVRRVRGLLKMSQAVFARFLGVDSNTVRSWEQGHRPPSAIARRFMSEIEADPEHWRRRIASGVVGVESKSPPG